MHAAVLDMHRVASFRKASGLEWWEMAFDIAGNLDTGRIGIRTFALTWILARRSWKDGTPKQRKP